MKSIKLYSGAIAIALSAVASAILVLTNVVEQSESLWVFLAMFFVSVSSAWLSVNKKFKSRFSTQHS